MDAFSNFFLQQIVQLGVVVPLGDTLGDFPSVKRSLVGRLGLRVRLHDALNLVAFLQFCHVPLGLRLRSDRVDIDGDEGTDSLQYILAQVITTQVHGNEAAVAPRRGHQLNELLSQLQLREVHVLQAPALPTIREILLEVPHDHLLATVLLHYTGILRSVTEIRFVLYKVANIILFGGIVNLFF